jgi:predicted transcriptional regulator
MPPRDVLSVRVSPAGLAQLDKLAADVETDRSTYARALLAEALTSPAVLRAADRRVRDSL